MNEQGFLRNQSTRLVSLLLAWIAFGGAESVFASVPGDTHSAASLQAKYAALGEQLQHNPFGRALCAPSAPALPAGPMAPTISLLPLLPA